MNTLSPLDHAVSLYTEQNFEELFEFCSIETQKDLENLELWKLFGVASGMTGRPEVAMRCFETIYNLSNGSDIHNTLNLITAYFHNDMAEEAIPFINKYHMRFEGKLLEGFLYTLDQAFGQYNKEQLLGYLDPLLVRKINMWFDRDKVQH